MKYSVDCSQPITLGTQGDTLIKNVVFDCADLIAEHPELTKWRIEAHTACGKQHTPESEMQGADLCWKITQADTACAGYGEYQIIAEGETGERKLFGWRSFVVLPEKSASEEGSCDCGGDSVTPDNDVQDILELVERAESAALRAEEVVDAMEDCEICNGEAELIFNGGDSITNLFEEEEGQ